VSTETQALRLGLAATLLLGLGLSDRHLLYVQPLMRPWLIVSGVVLVAITGGCVLARRTADPGDDDAASPDARDHHTGSLGWLLVLPLVAITLVPMEPLGSFAAARRPAQLPPASALSASDFPPLPAPVDGAAEMTLGGFVTLAVYDPARRLEDQAVRLTGFISSSDEPDGGVRLTRFALSCCAADASATSVALHGLAVPPPPDDTWVTIEGTWQPDPSGHEPDVPAVEVSAIRPIPTPTDPYER
jgi:uncharacterized repeat protein (TIGR03943 family)